MLLAFVLFWLVLGWGLYDGDIYAREGVLLSIVWLVLAVGYFTVPFLFIFWIVALVLVDVILLLKVFGQDILVR